MESEKLTGKIKDLEFRPHVLGEQVSRILTEAILEGVLNGGDQLIEAELQSQFGISRSPLREAFRDLEKKGLVVIIPRKGTYVKQVSRKDIQRPSKLAFYGPEIVSHEICIVNKFCQLLTREQFKNCPLDLVSTRVQ